MSFNYSVFSFDHTGFNFVVYFEVVVCVIVFCMFFIIVFLCGVFETRLTLLYRKNWRSSRYNWYVPTDGLLQVCQTFWKVYYFAFFYFLLAFNFRINNIWFNQLNLRGARKFISHSLKMACMITVKFFTYKRWAKW